MNLYAIHLEKMSESIFNFFLSRLEPERIARVRSYNGAHDADRALLGDVLARTMLCEQAGMSWGSLHVERNEFGKPYAANSHLEYSVSHAGDWIVCAIDNQPVGVDIEKIRPIDFNVAKYFFTNLEQKALRSCEPEHRKAYFFELWTVKESCLKAQGLGLHGPLNAFSVQIDEIKQVSMNKPVAIDKQVSINGLTDSNVQVYLSQQFPGYRMAVCSFGSSIPKRSTVLSLDSLLQRFLTVL